MLNNPIPKLLTLIPDELTLLDYVMLDSFRDVVKDVTHLIVNNHYILALLVHLGETGVISMHNISSIEGKEIFLIRNTYGRKNIC